MTYSLSAEDASGAGFDFCAEADGVDTSGAGASAGARVSSPVFSSRIQRPPDCGLVSLMSCLQTGDGGSVSEPIIQRSCGAIAEIERPHAPQALHEHCDP